MWTLLVLAALCVTSQVSAGKARGGQGGHGGGKGVGWGWWRNGDDSGTCQSCRSPCTAQYGEQDPIAICTCPAGFTCTQGDTSTRGIMSQDFTMSYCESDAAQPSHMGPPCSATKDGTTYDIGCPDGFTCSVGPVTDVSGWSLSYCNYASSDDVNTALWYEWVCDQEDTTWKSWCERDDWWGDHGHWRGYWTRCVTGGNW